MKECEIPEILEKFTVDKYAVNFDFSRGQRRQ